ncbi:protein JTB-like [Huso huso]|uniref:Protein JTB-like n=1 Tax=Huso huso TaxID=61971 RepID=A0ABR1ABV7_HUSHU
MNLSSFGALPFLWMGWSFFYPYFGFCEGAPFKQEDGITSNAERQSCWEIEEFTVQQECTRCDDYTKKTESECTFSGFVEKINCNHSGRVEYRSCRSATEEELKFWKFEGSMLSFGTVFAILVLFRQHTLDRRAEYKVLQQIEAI